MTAVALELVDDWQNRAACRDVAPDVMFPGRGESILPAQDVCHGCEVREACLAYALANNEKHGVWGGTSERQRRRIRRQRRLAGSRPLGS